MSGLLKKNALVVNFCLILLLCWTRAAAAPSPPAATAPAPLLQILQDELQRSLKGIKERGEIPAYFLSYTVTDVQQLSVEGDLGAIRDGQTDRKRILDIEVRVGSRKLDNQHLGRHVITHINLPLDDDVNALRRAIWLATDRQYRAAVKDLHTLEASLTVENDPKKHAPFSIESPHKDIRPLFFDLPPMADIEARMRKYSAVFTAYPKIYYAHVAYRLQNVNRYQVSSEGTVLQFGSRRCLLEILAETKADDGMELQKFCGIEKTDAAQMPSDEAALAAVRQVAEDLTRLRVAPVLDAYAGPAILSGRAAAVFFHENLGHRVEGIHQDDEREGQTFTNMLNRPVLPAFISVYDDPTMTRIGGVDLVGHYRYDDEGIPAQRVTIVDNGIFRGFLLSRTLVGGARQSNGHGRKAPGFGVVARQGNLLVTASQTVAEATLRRMLIEECKRQGKPFGLYFDEVDGGSTFTGGGQPQIYQVHPVMVYRVYADGRPDELVRGVEIIGTPLASFLNIKACSDRMEVFNGMCGALSGLVPVSAIAPGILTTQIETQKESWSPSRPPVLPPPPSAASAEGDRDAK